jgi:hypothetical protein
MNREVIVSIVVDPVFGSRLEEAAARGPVWIAATTANRAAAERWWTCHYPYTEFEAVTTFLVSPDYAPEEACAEILPTVDLHYGAHDDNAPMYDAVDVWGAKPVPALTEHLTANGYIHVTPLVAGFRASRNAPAV